jgi:uncharacterized repeat protein (TIGR03943 family)
MGGDAMSRFIRPIIMLLMTGFISYFAYSGHLAQYIAPKQYVYVLIGALLLLVIGTINLYLSIMNKPIDHCEDCSHAIPQSRSKQMLLYSLFLLPILIGLFVSNEINATELARVKGIQFQNGAVQIKTSELVAKNKGNLNEMFKAVGYAKDYAELGKRLYKEDKIVITENGFSELLSTLNAYKPYFVGKTMQVSGFVYREKGLQRNQIILSRLLLSCCSADAVPFGVLVQSDEIVGYNTNMWLTITGTLTLVSYKGLDELTILPESIVRMKKPKSAYIPRFKGKLSQLPQQ